MKPKIVQFRIDKPVIPYVRMTRRGKHVVPRAIEYLANRDELAYEFKRQMEVDMFDKTPLFVAIEFHVPISQGHKCDLDNLAKAVLDAMTGVVYRDDRWIDKESFTRVIDNGGYFKVLVADYEWWKEGSR
jgi:Holliday junction resolvase RusA-like endonuclease